MAKRINNLEQIEAAALLRRALIAKPGTCFSKPIPAAFIINLQGKIILRLIKHGLYLYQKKGK
jgi:hypothetical protein